MRRTKEEALATRKAILKAALKCFSKQGYALTTITDIAKRIKFSKGAVFWHFKSKEDLLAELILQECQTYDPLKKLDDAQTVADLKAAFMDWAEVLLKNRELRQFMTFAVSRIEWSETLKKTLAGKLRSVLTGDPWTRLLHCLQRLRAAELIETPLSDEQLLVLLRVTFMGTHREVWLNHSEIDILSTIEAGLDMILNQIERK
ncbi:MAG: TetR family transcriptional regulator [bacterium]|nr:TetR family transcriptional regulator [bacterium]